MKQRRKAILALLLSASVAASPVASATSVFAEDLDFAAIEETAETSEDADSDFSEASVSIEDSDETSDTTDDSILIDNSDSAEYSEADTDVFSDGDEVDTFTASGEVSVQADEEAKTHSITVNVVNSNGEVSGMYAMDNAIITKQDDGTYLVKMHQKSTNRNYMALTSDVTAATQHRVDWYVADSDWYYTIPVTNLTNPVYASFSYTKNVNKGSKWSNIQTITFDASSMADTTEPDVDASGMNKQAALDYTAADAALASVPEDLSIYTDETAKAVTVAVNKLKGNYKAIQQSDVDPLVEELTAAVSALVERGLLTVTNETLMFNVTKAALRDGNLIVTLHGKGYHYLYKGTYEEAVANGDNRDNWIKGDDSTGVWQFTIPVSEGETFIPIVAISNSYLTKYEQGKNTLERAFYPRQAVIDQDAATLVTGDYNHTKDLTVTNNVKMFNVAAASLETVGGPNSNNYKETLHLTMGSDSFDKVFIGNSVDAAAAETTTDIPADSKKVDLTVKANAMGGDATVDYLEKEVIFSFHSKKNDSWYERVFNVSKANGTLTITPAPTADYTAVDAALATVPEDLSIYTEETAAAVNAAVAAVKRDCTASQQAAVDKMAADITAAVSALVERGLLTVTNETLMFNVTKAALRDGKLIVTLSGKGYHYLYKGTYEEAVANGDNRDNWIKGDDSTGVWQFTIPVSEGETFIPIVAISNSYLTKYEQGKNSLERAFYPRQAVIDQDAATLVTGDYNHTKDLTVTNNVKMFNVAAASLETVGGPNSNNYKETLHLTMGSDSFDKVFIGSAVDAAAAETTTDITDRKVDLTVKANTMGGDATVDYLEKEVIFSFHSKAKDSWYERVFNVSKANGTLTITPVTIPATSVTLDTSSQKVETGKSFKLTATVAPANTTDVVVWSSSNEAVAKVDADGTVTTFKAGNAVITAAAGNVKAECSVTVVNPTVNVTGIKLTAVPSLKIAAGKKVQLKASVAPSNAANKAVTWTSSNTKVATVNANGVVTFKKNAGGKKVTVTATAKDGSRKYAKITLTCVKGSVKSIKLSGKTTIKAGKTTKVKAKVTTQKGKANKTLVWSSSNTKLATVDKNGKVKAIKGKKGTVKITATATDGSGKKATIKIKIK